MPSFFIDRPVFAWVIAILISLVGTISLLNMGVESYPNIAPPQVTVNATYPGASADTTEKTVTQVIEQQLTGIDHLLYFSSSSSSAGTASITLTFQTGTDPDIAQVQVQNKVSLATPRLPTEVTQQGVVVAKSNPDFLMFLALTSDNPDIDNARLNDIVAAQVNEQVGRISGVGSTRQIGAEYAMRVWLNPDKLQGYGLSASQVQQAIANQNVQFAAGALGSDPASNGQGFSATVSAEGRFSSPEQFGQIILRANPDGTSVKLSDVAKINFGGQTYGLGSTLDGKPSGALGVQLLPGANALDVATAVRGKMAELAKSFPPGVTWQAPYDSTPFVRISIKEVIETLIIAIVLVFGVMLLFLQNIRATIIPTLVIPVALLGTFAGLLALGFTINQLTLFGMVLAIGIVVDDAIVVIENVERIMTEEHLDPREATRKAMGQITGAVVAITVVLAAVFVPSAFQAGASGVIYKQFALTIAVSMGFSAFLALSFTPALCASILKPTHNDKKNFVYRGFNVAFDKVNNIYRGHIGGAVRSAPLWMIVFLVICLLCGWLFSRLPTSFVPSEDQGFALAIVSLPPGASLQRTQNVMGQIREKLHGNPNVDRIFQISGFSFVGSGENTGMAFIRLKDWDDRKATADEFIQQANGILHGIRDAQIFVVNLPTIRGLSQFGGIDMWLQARAGQSRDELTAARNTVLGAASQDPNMVAVRPNTLEDAPQIQLTVDRTQAQSMGLSVSDVYTAIQLTLAPVYINDFSYAGRVKRVLMQADTPYRMGPDAFGHIFTPSTLGTTTTTTSTGATQATPQMVPLSNVVSTKWQMASPALSRYNGYSAVEIVGNEAPGHSTGQAMNALSGIVDSKLPPTFGYDWTGQSYQEILSGNSATLLMILSILIVFLCLAALYESWSIPVSVLLVVPLGMLGTVVFSMLRGMPNDIYFKIGLITVIGLAAKNAILIIEFAVEQQAQGKTLREATIEASHLRLRPILMTSIAFILGVFPLFISTGAGANSRHSIGTGVIGGMLFATFLGLLLIPVFYVSVRRLLGDKLDEVSHKLPHSRDHTDHGDDSHGGGKGPNDPHAPNVGDTSHLDPGPRG